MYEIEKNNQLQHVVKFNNVLMLIEYLQMVSRFVSWTVCVNYPTLNRFQGSVQFRYWLFDSLRLAVIVLEYSDLIRMLVTEKLEYTVRCVDKTLCIVSRLVLHFVFTAQSFATHGTMQRVWALGCVSNTQRSFDIIAWLWNNTMHQNIVWLQLQLMVVVEAYHHHPNLPGTFYVPRSATHCPTWKSSRMNKLRMN